MSISLPSGVLFPSSGQTSQPGGSGQDTQTSEPGNTADTSSVNSPGETSASGTSDGGQNTGSGMSGGSSSGAPAYTGWSGSRPPDADSESIVRATMERPEMSLDDARARAIQFADEMNAARLIESLQDVQPAAGSDTDTDTDTQTETQQPTDVRV